MDNNQKNQKIIWKLTTDPKKNRMTIESDIGIKIHCEDIVVKPREYIVFMDQFKIAYIDRSRHNIPDLK